MKKTEKPIKFYFLLITYAIILYVAMQNLSVVRGMLASFFTVMEPLAYGVGIAFIINLFMNIFRNKVFYRLDRSEVAWKRKLCTALCAFSTFLVAAAMIAAIIFLIIPQITTAVNTLIEKMPSSTAQVFDWINAKLVEYNAPETLITQINQFNLDWTELLKFVTDFMDGRYETLLGTAFTATASVISTFTNVILGLIIAVYILAKKNRFLYVLKKLLLLIVPQNYQKRAFKILNLTNRSFASFLTGQFVEAIIIASLCTIGLTIFGFPYAGTIGILTGITALIPIFGAWIGGGVGALLILVDAPDRVLWFVVFIVVLQQLEGQFIYPKVVGNSLQLPGLIVLLSVILGGSFGGIGGIFFAVPVAAILYTLLKEIIDQKPVPADAPAFDPEENRKPVLEPETDPDINHETAEKAPAPVTPKVPAAPVQSQNKSKSRKKKKRR